MPTQSGFSRTIGNAIIPGGAAGVHEVPGDISDGDTILSVTQVTDTNPPVPTDRTAEFSIPAGSNGQISNTTTNTSGDFLIVSWAKGA